MGANKSATIVPGHGTLFVADVNTAMPEDWTDFALTGDAPDGWTNIGHTSKDNLPAFTKDGGDKTVLDTWLADSVDVIYASTQWGLTFNSLQVDQDNLDLAFGGSFDTDGGYIIPGSNTGTEKAIVLFSTDGTGAIAFYAPNTSVAIGDAPSIDAAKFLEMPISVSILTADSDVIPAAANGIGAVMKVYKTDLVAAAPVISSVTPTTGSHLGGVFFELVGRGFLGATGAGGVKFGTTNVGVGNYSVRDDEYISGVVPAVTAGAQPVTVVTGVGTSNAQAFTAS